MPFCRMGLLVDGGLGFHHVHRHGAQQPDLAAVHAGDHHRQLLRPADRLDARRVRQRHQRQRAPRGTAWCGGRPSSRPGRPRPVRRAAPGRAARRRSRRARCGTAAASACPASARRPRCLGLLRRARRTRDGRQAGLGRQPGDVQNQRHACRRPGSWLPAYSRSFLRWRPSGLTTISSVSWKASDHQPVLDASRWSPPRSRGRPPGSRRSPGCGDA